MAFQMFLFLLVFFLLLGLARLWHLSWPHLQPSHSKGGVLRTTVQRLLKPRTHAIALPTGCATSFNSAAIWRENVLYCSPVSVRQRYF